MSITVYFKNGSKTELKYAATVDGGKFFNPGAGAGDKGIEALTCKNTEGAVVGQFALSEVAGYEVT